MQRRGAFIVVGFIGAVAWVLLFRLVNNSAPTRPTVALALGLLFVAAGTVGALLSWYVQYRARGRESVTMALRQGAWLGLLLVVYGWLQLGKVLTPVIALVLLAIFITAESLFLLREHSL